MLGPKGFKTIIKNKCQVTCGHCSKTRGLGGDYWLMIAALSGGNPHILPLKVSHPLKLSTPNLKV